MKTGPGVGMSQWDLPGNRGGCRAIVTAQSLRKAAGPRQTFFGEPFQTILRKEAISDHALPPEA